MGKNTIQRIERQGLTKEDEIELNSKKIKIKKMYEIYNIKGDELKKKCNHLNKMNK